MNLRTLFSSLLTRFTTTDDSAAVRFSAEKVFKLTHTVSRSYQGAAGYGQYYFQFSDHMENVAVYNLDSHRLLCVHPLEMNKLYHCNNANFGKDKWDEKDEFPLLYVSMENIDAHCALVFRVKKEGDNFTFEKVQTVFYPDPREAGVYYPNCMVDRDNGFLYVMGYTKNSYNKEKNNHITVSKYIIPDAHTRVFNLKKEDTLSSFTVDSITATQGGLVVGGLIYQVYGFDYTSSFRILDPEKGKFVSTVFLPKHKFKSEPESLVFYNGDFYCADVTGQVFRFSLSL